MIGGNKPSEGMMASEREIGRVFLTDGEPTERECVESAEIGKGRHWGVLRVEWNGVTHTRGNNVRDRGGRFERTAIIWVRKGKGTVRHAPYGSRYAQSI